MTGSLDSTSAEPVVPAAHVNERSFVLGFALVIVTLGLYGVYWHFRVFWEVDRNEGQAHLTRLYVLVVALHVLAGAAVWQAAEAQSPPPEEWSGAEPVRMMPEREPASSVAAGGVLVLRFLAVGAFTAYLWFESAGLNQALRRQGQVTIMSGLLPLVSGLGLAVSEAVTMLVAAVLMVATLVGYAALQGGLNRYWRAVAVAQAADPAPGGPHSSQGDASAGAEVDAPPAGHQQPRGPWWLPKRGPPDGA